MHKWFHPTLRMTKSEEGSRRIEGLCVRSPILIKLGSRRSWRSVRGARGPTVSVPPTPLACFAFYMGDWETDHSQYVCVMLIRPQSACEAYIDALLLTESWRPPGNRDTLGLLLYPISYRPVRCSISLPDDNNFAASSVVSALYCSALGSPSTRQCKRSSMAMA